MMEFNRNFLINRLVHSVKNELSTLKLATSNLKFVLDDLHLPIDQQNQVNEFLAVIQENIKISIEALTRVLILTRESSFHFEPVNLGQILLDLSHHQSDVFLKDQSKSFVVHSEPNVLRWFFETLASLLTKQAPIELDIKPEENEIKLSFISDPDTDFSELLFLKNTTDPSFEALVVKHLALGLGIEISEQNAPASILILTFNQSSGVS